MANKYVRWWKGCAAKQAPKIFSNPNRRPGKRSWIASTEARSVVSNYRGKGADCAPDLPPSLHRSGEVRFQYDNGHTMASDSRIEAMGTDVN
jgi:hypothetical protein